MNDYKLYRSFGSSHEQAILLNSHGIVDEEINRPRSTFDEAELHTVIANTRTDVCAITMLLVDLVRRQRRMEKWVILAVLILAVIALR